MNQNLWRLSQLNYSNILSQPAYQRSPTSLFLPNSYSRTFFTFSCTSSLSYENITTCLNIIFLPRTGISSLHYQLIRYMGQILGSFDLAHMIWVISYDMSHITLVIVRSFWGQIPWSYDLTHTNIVIARSFWGQIVPYIVWRISI